MAESPAKVPRAEDADALPAALKALAKPEPPCAGLMERAFKVIMEGNGTPAQIGAFLALLNLDRCTPDIVSRLASTMRENAVNVQVPREGDMIVDIVGTGGDGQDTFNISTAAALLAASAGAKVVKHGNRAASSKSGAADILEALGARLELDAKEVGPVLAASGFAFLFARSYHPAMRHVGPVRQQIGIRTVFNILGPLTNPARPDCMLAGVFSPTLGRLYAEVFRSLGMKRAVVVHGLEGLDELSIAGPSKVWELVENDIKEYEVTPEATFGVKAHSLEDVRGGTAEENAKELREMFSGGGGREAVRDMVVMNAGAALYVTGKAPSFKEGVTLAQTALKDGKATAVVNSYVQATKPSA
jgi:anthranilate phosphoribosyltransferase